MARGSWTQSNFTGGQFSPAAAGRIDLPLYRSALAACTNMYPIEEGAVTRRPGTMFVQPSYLGLDGAIYPTSIRSRTPTSWSSRLTAARIHGAGLMRTAT